MHQISFNNIIQIYFTGVMSAFTVSSPVEGLSSRTIRFTHANTNIGSHYNTSTGVFTCQYQGLYNFELHILKAGGKDWVYCHIRKNGSNVVRAMTDPDISSDGGYYSATNSVVLHLVHGDTVDVGSCTDISNFMSTTNYDTSFSGFLLKPD